MKDFKVENIELLQKLRLLNLNYMNKTISGLYFLYNNKELIYIGQSQDIITRIKQHQKNNILKFDLFSYIELEDNRYLREGLERLYWFVYGKPHKDMMSKEYDITIEEMQKALSNIKFE